MTGATVKLGTFVFRDLEVPDRVILRNKQKLIFHRLTSGARAIDSAGTDIQTIVFRGIFSGQEASNRIKTLEAMREQGAPLLLSWDFQVSDVLMQDFELFYQSYRWVPYRLTLQVLDPGDPGQTTDLGLLGPTPAAQISDIDIFLTNTSLSMSGDVRSALLTLSQINHDTPPIYAVTATSGFVARIDSTIAAPTGPGQAALAENLAAADLSNLANTFRSEAYLRMARNRLKEIEIKAAQTGDTR